MYFQYNQVKNLVTAKEQALWNELMKFKVSINSGLVSKKILSKIYATLLNRGIVEGNSRYKWGKTCLGA